MSPNSHYPVVVLLLVIASTCWRNGRAEEMAVDLSSPGASERWMLMEGASIENGQLVMDGHQEVSRAFLLPHEWEDVTLRAKFMVEPAEKGVLACGFVVRATDAVTYYYVHFDRGQAILVRSDENVSWNEIKRVGGLDKPAGQWHSACTARPRARRSVPWA